MTIDSFYLLLSILLPLGAGYGLLLIIMREYSFPFIASLALAYGLGLGILTQWMLLLGIFEIPLHLGTIGLPLCIFALCLVFLYLKKYKTSQSKKNHVLLPEDNSQSSSNYTFLLKLLCGLAILFIGYNLIFVFWRSLTISVQSFDVLATISFKAKIIYFDGSLHRLNLPHGSYPLHVPFTQAWITMNLGRWDNYLIKIIFPLTFSAYIAFQYYYIKSLAGRIWAALSICLLLFSNFFVFHATIGYRDFFMMYYNCTTIILIILWQRKKYDNILTLASLFAGITTFTKLEGTGYLFAHTLLLLYILWKENSYPLQEKTKKLLRFMVPSFSICLIFHLYKIQIGLANFANRIQFINLFETFDRILVISQGFITNLFYSGNWNLIWLVLLFSMIINFKRIKIYVEVRIFLLALTIFFAMYFAIPIFTINIIYHPTLLSRTILHFFPLSVILIILLNHPLGSHQP